MFKNWGSYRRWWNFLLTKHSWTRRCIFLKLAARNHGVIILMSLTRKVLSRNSYVWELFMYIPFYRWITGKSQVRSDVVTILDEEKFTFGYYLHDLPQCKEFLRIYVDTTCNCWKEPRPYLDFSHVMDILSFMIKLLKFNLKNMQ